MNLFEVIVKLKTDWIDLSGVPETELFKALSHWSSGREGYIHIKSFTFAADDIVSITVSR